MTEESTSTAPDKIDLETDIDTTPERAWELVGEPGWFVNDGTLTAHKLEWQGGSRVTVSDPNHGSFTFEVEALDAPRYTACRGLDADGNGGSRLVEFWLTPVERGVRLRVVESGFASMRAPVAEQVAQHEHNTRTWRHQLDLARERLAPSG